MNPHLKVAYDQGVQKALEDAGLIKEANLLTKMKDIARGFKDSSRGYSDNLGRYSRKRLEDLLASRPVSAITGSRMKNLTGDALEAEKKLVDMARSGSVLGAAGLAGLGIYAAKGEPPKSRASNALARIFGDQV